jgi:leucyl-tRNA synthetase
MPYDHQSIEKKWQERWGASDVFRASDKSNKPKYYCLIEFPYPSGAGLHIGHPRSYTALDVVARKRRMQGFNVLYPIGWDAFGLPTENYAIKTGRRPQDVTAENIATFKRQLKSLGLSFDWSREINTTDPQYYKWTQWMFLEFFKAGLAYKAKQPINWCLSCKIGLANEEVVGGECERCGGKVEKRDKEQWMIAITKYADRLLADLDSVDYLEKIKIQQKNWIGKSEGAEIKFQNSSSKIQIEVFTTRPDTILGATFIVISPEAAKKRIEEGWEAPDEVRRYVDDALACAQEDRADEKREKTGVDTGIVVKNPANNEMLPVWVADYVLGGYGTGAIMAVPQHDDRDREFATKFGLPIVDRPLLEIDEALEETGGKKAVRYKLRDWVFSRQRYWGEPIPLIRCEKCGWVPVPVEQLPVVLPEVGKYEPTDTGESPLATIKEWVNTTCPKCGCAARRETDTMPNWAGSSWYFLAYAMSNYFHDEFALRPPTSDLQPLKYWLPVDLYNGGMEHTTLHLLYSRFWNKFLFDRGFAPTCEPYARRHSHGLVLAQDGTKMSKSKGNVVNPDELVSEYGADALRMYLLFMGPFEEPVPWSMNGLVGVRRFLEKVAKVVDGWNDTGARQDAARELERGLKKISDDIEAFKFNTAVAEFMSLFNILEDSALTREQLKRLLIVLCPFAPHLANECWEKIGEKGFVEEQSWPQFDESLLVQSEVEIAVQVNGKVRATVKIAPDTDDATARNVALVNEAVAKHVAGKEVVKIVYVKGKIINVVTR